jgi:hypothetical protein
MGMDLAALKARLAGLNKGTKKANDIWKPKDKHLIRLLPYFNEDPMQSLSFHYDIGEQSVLCPKTNFGDDCVICDFCDLLKSWKDENGNDKAENVRKQDWEMFKKIQPKARVFVAMVERTKEEEGAKFWGVTPNQAQQLLEACADGDRLEAIGLTKDDDKNALDVLFGKKAFDIEVDFSKPGEKGNTKSFAQIKITPKIKATPIMPSEAAAKKLLESVKRLTEVYPRVTSAEVEKIFKKFIGSSSAESKPDGGTEKYSGKTDTKAESKKPANSGENAAKVGGRSIDDAFGELTGEK